MRTEETKRDVKDISVEEVREDEEWVEEDEEGKGART